MPANQINQRFARDLADRAASHPRKRRYIVTTKAWPRGVRSSIFYKKPFKFGTNICWCNATSGWTDSVSTGDWARVRGQENREDRARFAARPSPKNPQRAWGIADENAPAGCVADGWVGAPADQ